MATKKHSEWFQETFLGKNKEGGPGSGRRPGHSSDARLAKRQAALGKSAISKAAFTKKSDAIKKGQAASKDAQKRSDWAAGTRIAKKAAGV